MKFVWIVIVALLLGGAVLFLLPTSTNNAAPLAPLLPRTSYDPPPITIAPTPPPQPTIIDAPITTPPAVTQEIIRRIDARTIELAGKYRVVGNGTEADPYIVSWELLLSASTTINAATGALEAPKWVMLLDGQWIEISAYYSTVVRKESVDELLLTLNRWDGCCIGLPPTPFDSIEAKLASPIRLTGLHLTRFGTFRGQLHISPLSAAGFLLGLYRVEHATMTQVSR